MNTEEIEWPIEDVSSNYWGCTQGNAKHALSQLLALAQLRPDGVWRGD